mgnify:CR=1 FL=1|tara:strand:+ start:7692 stop:7871 length:180 start_codon:yes stop_codon:yes gene_type:complete
MKTIKQTCAIAFSLDLLGDKWSLLILRDAILHKKTRFKEYIDSKEKSQLIFFLTGLNFW